MSRSIGRSATGLLCSTTDGRETPAAARSSPAAAAAGVAAAGGQRCALSQALTRGYEHLRALLASRLRLALRTPSGYNRLVRALLAGLRLFGKPSKPLRDEQVHVTLVTCLDGYDLDHLDRLGCGVDANDLVDETVGGRARPGGGEVDLPTVGEVAVGGKVLELLTGDPPVSDQTDERSGSQLELRVILSQSVDVRLGCGQEREAPVLGCGGSDVRLLALQRTCRPRRSPRQHQSGRRR